MTHATLMMIRGAAEALWRLSDTREKTPKEVRVPLNPRFLSDDMHTLKRVAMRGVGIVALPGYVCREETRNGALRRVLPDWKAEDSMLTALIPTRQGVPTAVRAFLKHLGHEMPRLVGN
jgi:DNA-binding transcriptional LysR family regulator